MIPLWKQNNQQERLFKIMFHISDDYLTGFIEGEGCFYIGIAPSKETLNGWQVIHFFKVSQNPSGKVILDFLKKRLGCGYVKLNAKPESKDKTLAYVVRDINNLSERVIPFLENKLIIKRGEFERFKKVVELVKNKNHLTKRGFNQIVQIAYSMNTKKRKILKRILTDYTPNSVQTEKI